MLSPEREQYDQLIRLRDYLRRNKSRMEFTMVENCMADFLSDNELILKLMTPVFSRALWYCMCNSNADRNMLISKLFDYFTSKHNLGNHEALELIKYALFLGGIDLQQNEIAVPEAEVFPDSRESREYNAPTVSPKVDPPTTKKKISKWLILAIISAFVILAIVLIARSCCSGDEDKMFTKIDMCRVYHGEIAGRIVIYI